MTHCRTCICSKSDNAVRLGGEVVGYTDERGELVQWTHALLAALGFRVTHMGQAWEAEAP